MRTAEMKNAPNPWGWAIGVAAGAVAFGVLVVVGEFDLLPAAFLGGCVALVVGLILGMPSGATVPAPAPGVAADAPSQPVAGAVVQPAALVAAPDPAPAATAARPEARPKAAATPKAAGVAGPERLTAPRNGKADDLKEIEGIGPALEKLVNSLGFYHFDQIASWSEADVAIVDAEMKNIKGRITRDRWVAQARIIVSEGLEAFRERAKTNNY